ncbi:MAG TPA: hypothetical protein VGJ48_25405 [Pyrinomonadaceae bacterium]|jgi:hypothetical protein
MREEKEVSLEAPIGFEPMVRAEIDVNRDLSSVNIKRRSLFVPTKRLLVLANSIKNDFRCIAGREIEGETRRLGPWIRPVSGSGHGELRRQHYALEGGGFTSVLDLVDVPLISAKDDPGQPENWLVDENVLWTKVATFDAGRVHELAETPDSLWFEAGSRSDRISVPGQRLLTPQRSLVLVSPVDFKIRMWREFNPFQGYTQRKTRGVFNYGSQSYQLSITDPVFTSNHCRIHPAAGDPPVVVEPPCGDRCLLCISLTSPFRDYHYKVIATVLQLP